VFGVPLYRIHGVTICTVTWVTPRVPVCVCVCVCVCISVRRERIREREREHVCVYHIDNREHLEEIILKEKQEAYE
jgi:hypothetical protein